MHATAKLTGYRQAPRKVRLVAGLVRGKMVEQALVELDHRAKRAAPVFVKLIKSAVANAKALGLDVTALKIKELRVDQGPIMKRNRPRAQGRAFPIHKHTSHILVTLVDMNAEKKQKEESPAKKVKSSEATKTALKEKSSKAVKAKPKKQK